MFFFEKTNLNILGNANILSKTQIIATADSLVSINTYIKHTQRIAQHRVEGPHFLGMWCMDDQHNMLGINLLIPLKEKSDLKHRTDLAV